MKKGQFRKRLDGAGAKTLSETSKKALWIGLFLCNQKVCEHRER